jgi:hypothetical protein
MQNPFIRFKTGAFAAALDPLDLLDPWVAPDGDARPARHA